MDLSIDFEDLVNNELELLQLLTDDVLKIPISASRRYMGSYFFYALEVGSPELPKKTTKKETKYYEDFQKLCKLAPHVPIQSLRAISLAYGGIGMLYEPLPRGEFIKNNGRKVIEYLMISSYARGIAQTEFQLKGEKNDSANENEQQKRLSSAVASVLIQLKNDQSKKLSMAGLMGAQSKNRPYKALEEWILEKSKGRKEDDKEMSRHLFAEIPVHLAKASTDPMRFIYDTLRVKRKLN